MTVMEIDRAEVDAYNEAIFELHDLCDEVREIRDACELGELELSDEEWREIRDTVRDRVQMCERWQIALYLKPMRVPVVAEPEPEEPAAENSLVVGRAGPYGMVSFGPAPNVSFGNTVSRPGAWYG